MLKYLFICERKLFSHLLQQHKLCNSFTLLSAYYSASYRRHTVWSRY